MGEIGRLGEGRGPGRRSLEGEGSGRPRPGEGVWRAGERERLVARGRVDLEGGGERRSLERERDPRGRRSGRGNLGRGREMEGK